MMSDIKNSIWIEKCPAILRPYLILSRIDRPIGIWLLLLPGLWGVALASDHLVDHLWIAALFVIGAIIMRAAGCVMNDIWDRNLDSQVARTRSRPLANGDLTVRQAVIFLLGLCVMGLIILLQFNALTILLGVLSLPLIAVYPAMKRLTWWPQAFLGLTFNFSALMGWSAVTGSLSLIPVLLYMSAIFWTLAYDTIYAHQDKEDDMLIGIKSTALRLGGVTKAALVVFYGLQFLFLGAVILMTANHIGALAFLIPAALHTVWQVKRFDATDPALCLAIFKASRDTGVLILLAVLF